MPAKITLNKQARYLYSFGSGHVVVSCTQRVHVGATVVFRNKAYLVSALTEAGNNAVTLTLQPV